jgi:hypothetical protein
MAGGFDTGLVATVARLAGLVATVFGPAAFLADVAFDFVAPAGFATGFLTLATPVGFPVFTLAVALGLDRDVAAFWVAPLVTVRFATGAPALAALTFVARS